MFNDDKESYLRFGIRLALRLFLPLGKRHARVLGSALLHG